ncbi:MAG: glycerophosphodiester phosphodiesterase [Methylococcaceae bacterium]|nr:glycerophosphodiester phosphodiesterase [Methylococcaceae bacterium]
MLNQLYKPTFWAAALAIAGFQSGVEASPEQHNAPLVIGHRGTAGYRPEHTLEGYTLAIDLGADFIEPDLVLTKDGYMVARHEPMIGATTNVAAHPEFATRKTKRMVDGVEYNDWFVTDFTLAEIKTLRAIQALANRDPQYNNLYSIPTLDEIIALAKRKSLETGRSIGIYPEIKHSTYHATAKEVNNHLLFGQNVFEDKLLNKLHAEFGNSACAPVFIQSFEVSNLQYLRHKTHINLVQLVDADDVNADGSLSLVAPYKQPYDFVVAGKSETFADLLTENGLAYVKSYADVIAPWKTYLVKTVDDGIDRNKDGKLTLNDRRVEGSTGVIERAHKHGLRVHTWTFRNDASGYGFSDPKAEMAYYFKLGIDGLFTDFADTGVAARYEVFPRGEKLDAFKHCQHGYQHHEKADD